MVGRKNQRAFPTNAKLRAQKKKKVMTATGWPEYVRQNTPKTKKFGGKEYQLYGAGHSKRGIANNVREAKVIFKYVRVSEIGKGKTYLYRIYVRSKRKTPNLKTTIGWV